MLREAASDAKTAGGLQRRRAADAWMRMHPLALAALEGVLRPWALPDAEEGAGRD